MDALGVIAVGVGGLGRNRDAGPPSMMRLPDIVGVELTGQRQPGITATDIVLALTEFFLRKERVVGAYVEFFGEGADSLSIGDRATISNMCPEYGATAAMFYIDQQTIDYLKLTGREPSRWRWSKIIRQRNRPVGRCAENRAIRARAWSLTCPAWCVTWLARPTRTASACPSAAPSAALPMHGLAAARAEEAQGLMPDGAVVIAAITSCTNTSNPRNVVAAALLAKKPTNWAWCANRG